MLLNGFFLTVLLIMLKSKFLNSISPADLRLNLNVPPIIQTRKPGWITRQLDYNQDYDLFLIYNGVGLFSLDFKTYRVKSGEAVLIRPGQSVNIRNDTNQELQMIAQHFELKLYNKIDIFAYINFKHHVRFSNLDFFFASINQILEHTPNTFLIHGIFR